MGEERLPLRRIDRDSESPKFALQVKEAERLGIG